MRGVERADHPLVVEVSRPSPGTRGDVVLSLNHFLAGTMQSAASVGRQVEDIYR